MENTCDENSDDGEGLRIVIETPRPKKRTRKEFDESDKKIIECIEKDIEEDLEEKAAKANLTAKHVKNIIKEVVTNEHVLALVRQVENPDEPITVYEPKYTRAKTKELLSTNTKPKILPWSSPVKSVSEVQMLISEELQEDSSGDEYIPETPSKNYSFNESLLETTQGTIKDDEEEAANIALRTRSKLSLNHTPLEVIEEAFMPPDITTDMYDMDCDDDVWREFLKTFTRPLDEVTKAAEDEDHDPEYNVLADEEIDEVDREELRADRAVTVSRKEFNCLMAELFEYADIYESNQQKDNELEESTSKDETAENDTLPPYDPENDPNISIRKCQIPILAQQMRQHVQLLTQNFLLSYEHPEFNDMADKFKEMLSSVDEEVKEKSFSVCNTVNLRPALKLVEDWENLGVNNDEKIAECRQHTEKVLAESIEAKRAGSQYVVTFPPFLMKIVANSEVFLYTGLLPRIPFRSSSVTRSSYHFFTHGEQSLIALFLEHSVPQVKQDCVQSKRKFSMEYVCYCIHKFLMPHVSPRKIVRFIQNKKHPDSEENPIKFFYRNKKAPPTVHYLIPMDDSNVMSPNKRNPDSLPLLWRDFIYPNYKNDKVFDASDNDNNNQLIIISSPVQLRLFPTVSGVPHSNENVSLSEKSVEKSTILPKESPSPPVTNNYTRRKKYTLKKRPIKVSNIKSSKSKNLTVLNQVELIHNIMLPDMPSLGNTPVKNQQTEPVASTEKDNETQNLTFKNVTHPQFEIQFQKPKNVSEIKRNFENIVEFSQSQGESTSVINNDESEKDNPDDINELMIASSTVKNIPKKEPSGAEKKRAKMRREFVANLLMATPDDPDTEVQKDESFADAFFEKLRHTLTVEDYDKLIDILGHYDETNGKFMELYKNVQSVLHPTYKELSEEFLLFLTEIQAHKVKQLMPYLVMKDMDRFMKKIQIYFKDQPSQMKKIIKCLTDLSEDPNITMDKIKSTIVPLFKGNVALTDWFLQIFPCERPPKLLTSGPHEVIDLSKELARLPEEEICETVLLPDTEDPYGGPSCICPCHNDENPQFQSRSQHCKKCGLKFIQGKIYIQSGKALRPAVVSFLTNPQKDHSKRLTATQRKRSDTSPSKQVTSPSKETHDELRHSNESEDEGEHKRKNPKQPKTQRKRKIKEKIKDPSKVNNKENSSKTCDKTKSSKSSSPKRQSKKRTSSKKNLEIKPGSSAGQQKRLADDPEIEYTEPAEFVEMKVSSDHSGESESEFFESSQDVTNTDSEASSCSSEPTPKQQTDTSWSREEDKIILQAFQQRSNNEETFKHISELLQNRSVVEIKSRFNKLMSLLQQMTNPSSS